MASNEGPLPIGPIFSHVAPESRERSKCTSTPRDCLPCYNLGNALARTGDRAAAISSYRQALRCQPAFARAHNNLGVLLLDDGDTAGAIRHFESAVKFDPVHSSARKNLEFAKQRVR